MTEKFLRAVAKTMAHEGGYVNDPADPGGETKYGISKRTFPDLEIGELTEERARAIYHRDFWEPNGYERISHEGLAEKVFDLAVNMGPSRANRLLQRAVATTFNGSISIDGKLGPETLAAVNLHPDGNYLLATLKLLAIDYYVALRKPKYLTGWILRALS